MDRRIYNFRYPSVDHYVGWFREYYGPTVKAFSALDSNGHDTLANHLEGLCESRNVSGDGTMAVSSAYLEVVTFRR